MGKGIYMLIFGILVFIVAILLLLMYLDKSKKYNNNEMTTIIGGSMLLFIMGTFFCTMGYKMDTARVKTNVTPQIDTLVSIKNGVADTTYVYNFEKLNF